MHALLVCNFTLKSPLGRTWYTVIPVKGCTPVVSALTQMDDGKLIENSTPSVLFEQNDSSTSVVDECQVKSRQLD